MENKRIEPRAKIHSVKYVLVDGTEIVWVKIPGSFKVIRKLPDGPVEVLESTDLSPTSECAYFLLNSKDFKEGTPTVLISDNLSEIKSRREQIADINQWSELLLNNRGKLRERVLWSIIADIHNRTTD